MPNQEFCLDSIFFCAIAKRHNDCDGFDIQGKMKRCEESPPDQRVAARRIMLMSQWQLIRCWNTVTVSMFCSAMFLVSCRRYCVGKKISCSVRCFVHAVVKVRENRGSAKFNTVFNVSLQECELTVTHSQSFEKMEFSNQTKGHKCTGFV